MGFVAGFIEKSGKLTFISELHLPEDCVIISITRNGQMIIPRGKTVLHSGDTVLVLVGREELYRLGKALGVEQLK